MLAGDDLALYRQITGRLKAAKQWQNCAGQPPHPGFVGIKAATDRLFQHVAPDAAVLVMRDQCLFHTRVGVLATGRTLLVPDELGQDIYRIPRSALRYGPPGSPKPILRIDPLPPGSEVWRGRVDIIVVGCTAWSRDRRQLWSLDWDNTAATLEELGPCEREWNDTSWFIPGDVPVVCLAADEQEIHLDVDEAWPAWAAGHCADAVITPTQTVILGAVG
jgi:hypothetical protein